MRQTETYTERRRRMRYYARQLADLREKEVQIANPAYTELSSTGLLLLRSSIQALERKLHELAVMPVYTEGDPRDGK